MTVATEPPAAAAVRTAPYPPPPLTRWGITWRYLVSAAGVVFMALNLLLYFAAGSSEKAVPDWVVECWIGVELGGLIVGIWLIRYRRRWPLRITLILVLVNGVSTLCSPFATWAYVSLCTRLRWKEMLTSAAAWFVVGALQAAWLSWLLVKPAPTGTPAYLPRLIFVAVFLISWAAGTAMYTAIGTFIGSQRRDVAVAQERAEQAQREQSLRVQQGRADERARIAREMHDVVAHRISLVAMHSGAMAFRTDLEPEQMREIARGIQDNATAALTELRAVLAELRESEQPSQPQPSLAAVPTLLEELRAAGMSIEATSTADGLDTLAPAQSRHAYRIVQECLTNARKHAVNAPVTLALDGDPQRGLTIEVRNPRTYAGSVPGSGLGLVGLGERAELAGGRLVAGPDLGDFVVKAWLPWNK